MRPVLALAILLMASSAAAEVQLRVHDAGAVTQGIAIIDGGEVLTHQDITLHATGSKVTFTSATLHDHDGFFWSLTQPGAGPWDQSVTSSTGDAHFTSERAPPGHPIDAAVRTDGADIVLDTTHPVTAFWRLVDDGTLVAWGVVEADATTTLASSPVAMTAIVHLESGADSKRIEHDHAPQAGAAALPDLMALLPGEDAVPAPCMDVRQEPADAWFVDTHVRLSIDPGARMDASDLLDVHYVLSDTDGAVLGAHAVDPFGHAVMKAPAAGAYTLDVVRSGETCRLPIEVRASSGSIEPIWSVEANPGGFTVSFDTDSGTHYDVEGVVQRGGALVYAGKLHSHSTGTSAEFQVPPGSYAVDLYPVAQGEGPTVVGPLHATMIVSAAAATPPVDAPLPLAVLVAALAVVLWMRR